MGRVNLTRAMSAWDRVRTTNQAERDEWLRRLKAWPEDPAPDKGAAPPPAAQMAPPSAPPSAPPPQSLSKMELVSHTTYQCCSGCPRQLTSPVRRLFCR